MGSFGVEGAYEFHKVSLSLVLNFLFLHAQVVIIAVVGVDDDLIEIANDADLSVGLHISLSPLIEFCLLDIDLVFVHDFVIDLLVLTLALDLAVLGVLDKLQHVIALQDDLFLFLAAHIVA